MNKQLLLELPGSVQVYKSIDTTCDTNEVVNYTADFLNTLEPTGVPSHTLELKIGAPIMLLRNLHPPSLCNGTRLCIKKLMPNGKSSFRYLVIKAQSKHQKALLNLLLEATDITINTSLTFYYDDFKSCPRIKDKKDSREI
ncbi:hypothetical protein AVEN_14833-1 [Araneus ventricosus]|uniref:DNA helicase Pif1-like 2B domain-containing protein n=1 Tax=Araneus ventricosus TaxID=182803 RepID=A0A4Y2UH16_ARAVE|nr:hypothetical protein AVEN_7554-1 [Araneus ventricosus]GBO12168.1 hypothetical protein AVEN_14833-1 [Araneus ventricosus]